MKTVYTSGKALFALFCSLILLMSTGAMAQARKSLHLTANGGANLIIYSPKDTSTKKPVFVFFPGTGECGTDPNKLYVNGPLNFIQSGWTPDFWVVGAQPPSGPAGTNWVQMILNELARSKGRYNIDTNRIYLTGLSYGCVTIIGYIFNIGMTNGTLVKPAAIIPMSYSVAHNATAEAYLGNSIAAWGFGGDADGHGVSLHNWFQNYYIPDFPTPAKKFTFYSGGHCCWNTYYNPNYREDGLNVYEFCLKYSRSGTPVVPTNANPVANAGPDQNITLPATSVNTNATASDPDGSIASYSWTKTSGPTQFTLSNPGIINPVISGLVAGTYIFRLTVTDNKGATAYDEVSIKVNSAAAPVVIGSTKPINVNIYGGTNPYNNAQWNDWNVGAGSVTNVSSNILKYNDGTASSVSANLSEQVSVADNGASYVSVMAPAPVLRYTSYSTVNRNLTLVGLNAAKKYSIQLYACRSSNSGNSTTFTSGSASSTVATYDNSSNIAQLSAIKPGTDGRIIIAITPTATYSYISGFTITEDADTTPVTPPAVPVTPTAKLLQVNVYGGTNPYSNSAWNNWNVGTAAVSNVNSGTLKYSDGTLSSVSMVLNQSLALADNGTTYTASFAPQGVVRYASYSNISRTLTISGLTTTKKYDLELYATRNSNPNYNTLFTLGSLVSTVSTYDNTTKKALFSGISPDASGNIIVNISGSAKYNYINGLVITEGSSSTTAAVNQSSVGIESQGAMTMEETELSENAKMALSVSPNPVHDMFTLQLSNHETGNMSIQILDMHGTVRQSFNKVKEQDLFTQQISIANLAPGTYILRIQIKNWMEIKKILKL